MKNTSKQRKAEARPVPLWYKILALVVRLLVVEARPIPRRLAGLCLGILGVSKR